MPRIVIPGPIRNATIKLPLDPQIEVTATDGTKLLARTLFIYVEHSDRRWKNPKIEVAAAKPAPRAGGYSTLYRKTSDFRHEGKIKEIIDDNIAEMKAIAKSQM